MRLNRLHRGVLAALLFPLAVCAQTYPERTVRIVVPYPPGGSTDALARLLAQKMTVTLKQPVIVENRAGASGNIGADHVAKSAPDGYTLLLGTDATHGTNSHLSKQFPYDPIRDFTPITNAVINIIGLGVHPSVPATNLRELIDYAKKNPGKLAYGSSGTGSPHHLAGVLLGQLIGSDLVHVPYKGGGPAVQDLVGGQIQLAFSSLVALMPHAKANRVRALGVIEATRYAGQPDLPTIGEIVPGFALSSWLGFFAPAKLPPAILTRIHAEMVAGLTQPDVKSKLEASGLVVIANSPSEFAAQVRAEVESRGKLLKAAAIQPE